MIISGGRKRAQFAELNPIRGKSGFARGWRAASFGTYASLDPLDSSLNWTNGIGFLLVPEERGIPEHKPICKHVKFGGNLVLPGDLELHHPERMPKDLQN